MSTRHLLRFSFSMLRSIMFLKRALGSKVGWCMGGAGEIRKYVQVAYPSLHAGRGELGCDGVYMVDKTLVEAADGVPACAHVTGALEGHGVVKESRGVMVDTAELEGVLVRGAGVEGDAVTLFLP
jgi:hypothetical protein